MAKKKELYQGTITEFVDWISGVNSRTSKNVTGGLQPSGTSIGNLLQDHLKKPFVVSEDKINGFYLMFSSKEALEMYNQNPEENLDLIMFKFTRPSDIELSIESLDTSVKYLKSTDSLLLDYSWVFKKGTGDGGNYAVSIKYSVSDKDGNEQSKTEYFDSTITSVSNYDITSMLKLGKNIITITIKSDDPSVSASTSRTFTANVITLTLDSSFNFNKIYSPGSSMTIPFVLTRNEIETAVFVYFYIDKTLINTVNIEATDTSTIISRNPIITNILDEGGQHNLQIVAKISKGGKDFYSNLMYFTYVNSYSTSSNTSSQQFVNIKYSLDTSDIPVQNLVFQATQYEPFTLQWGYTTYDTLYNSTGTIVWHLKKRDENIIVGSIQGSKGEQSSDLSFIPTVATAKISNDEIYDTFLEPIFINGSDSVSLNSTGFTINIAQTKLNINETADYSLKLSAYGRSNGEGDSASIWEDTKHNYTDTDGTVKHYGATFHNIAWDDNSGWYNNSFRTIGENSWAEINYAPLSQLDPTTSTTDPISTGRTIEIEFESENISSEEDVLISIGDSANGHIDITPNSAGLYIANTTVIKTNFKANERMKIAFIIHPSTYPQDVKGAKLAYIVNNGVLERAAQCINTAIKSSGTITIGKCNSGVRIYNLRVYPTAITYADELNNFIYDSEDKGTIISDNNVTDKGIIDYTASSGKINTILLSGDLSQILNMATNKDDSKANVDIEYRTIDNDTSNFSGVNIMIRKHGQSTLNYPITSMKIWTNKSTADNITHSFVCDAQKNLGLNKSRWILYKNKQMTFNGKTYIKNSIPSNKFVFQANYADSSGAQNGTLQKLIHRTWYDAVIDGQYRLRTDPQLFSTGKTVIHNDTNIGETSWVEGYGLNNKLWTDYFPDKDFPYEIRISPDSLPISLFYYNTTDTVKTKKFLGQYVLMDDKKSDFTYGERSIYKIYNDPFCLYSTNAKEDTDENLIWDNNRVIRIEVVEANTIFSSFMDDSITNIVNGVSITYKFNDIIYTSSGADHYRWEEDFEMVYPDPDDLEGSTTDGTDKYSTEYDTDSAGNIKKDDFGNNKWKSKFRNKAQYFIYLFEWLVESRKAYLATDTTASKDVRYKKFRDEAADHLDLYKLAAYYIYFLRFGLVDSVERNAQLKTYDGRHWHIEPWDMDIGLGKQNNGNIAYEPPMDRNTMDPDGLVTAFSGRSYESKGGKVKTSNWLWDALEDWDYWSQTIVPKVAQALWTAGLKYSEIISVFDEDYSNKWCETFYNESGHYKYIEVANDLSWLPWLQGTGVNYRHWWINMSMNYYDAKWNCGDFKNHNIYISANYTGKEGEKITIVPNAKTFFNFVRTDTNTVLATIGPVTKESPAVYDMNGKTLSVKVPFSIYGATNIEELDLSDIAQGLTTLTLGGAYNDTLGAPIKKLTLGVKRTISTDGKTYTAKYLSTSRLTISSVNKDGNDALTNLETYDIAGLQSYKTFAQFNLNDTKGNYKNQLKYVYAEGSGLQDFWSAETGNKYKEIRLPNSVVMIDIKDSTWESMTFWDTVTGAIQNMYYVKPSSSSTIATMTTEDTGIPVYTYIGTDPIVIRAASGDDTGLTYNTNDVIAYEDYSNSLIGLTDTAGVFIGDGNVNTAKYSKYTIESNPTFVKHAEGGDETLNIPSTLMTVKFRGTTGKSQNAKKFILSWINSILKAGKNINDYTLIVDNISWGNPNDNTYGISYEQLTNLAKFNAGKNSGVNIKGYVLLNDETPMTQAQMIQIQNWFGSSAFIKNSNQLVVDQNKNYIQVTFSGGTNKSYSQPIIIDDSGNISIYEGTTNINLFATKFLLGDASQSGYEWNLFIPGSTIAINPCLGCEIVKSNDRYYLNIQEYKTGQDYNINLSCTGNNQTTTLNFKILAKTYPASYTIENSFNNNDAYIRSNSQNTIMYFNGLRDEFYVKPDITSFTATINSINFSLKTIEGTELIPAGSFRRSDFYNNKDSAQGEFPMSDGSTFMYLKYDRNSSYGGIPLIAQNTDDFKTNYYTLTLTSTVNFISGKQFITTKKILLIDDNVELVKAGGNENVYRTLSYNSNKTFIFTTNGTARISLYKSDLIPLTGKLDFSYVNKVSPKILNGNTYGNPIDNVLTAAGDSVLNYLPNISELNFSYCSNLNSYIDINGSSVTMTTFDKMTNLKKADFSNCSKLTYDLDFTYNSYLESVNVSGSTYVNVIFPQNSKLKEAYFSYQTSISIINPAYLNDSTVTNENPSYLTSIDLENINTNGEYRTFNTFAKLMGLPTV